MPLYHSIQPDKQTTVHVWKIEEGLSELRDRVELGDESEQRLQRMRSELHQRAFLSVRLLLKEENYDDSDLFYNSYGKPLLRDGNHISITHSFDFSAIIVSKIEVGIDVEKNREKILRIRHRFVNTEYDSLSDEDLIKQLTVIWGAKESMYKTYPYGGLSFHDHIAINPFRFDDRRSTGRIIFGDWKRKYDIYFHFFKEGFTLVYALSRSEIIDIEPIITATKPNQ